MDLGSGAGVPGIPIKIVRSDAEVTLVESRRRRASFLSNAVRELGLAGVQVLNARVEGLVGKLEKRFDAVVIRCAGDYEELISVARQLLGPRGVVVAAGPPVARPLPGGCWVTVPGVKPGTVRRFAVASIS